MGSHTVHVVLIRPLQRPDWRIVIPYLFSAPLFGAGGIPPFLLVLNRHSYFESELQPVLLKK